MYEYALRLLSLKYFLFQIINIKNFGCMLHVHGYISFFMSMFIFLKNLFLNIVFSRTTL